LPRRNPWELARETVTLDHLSGGRLVFGVGSGSDFFGEISMFDAPREARLRAEMMDEALVVITGLWSGAKFDFSGRHFRMKEACFVPRPLQSPRIPIWVPARGRTSRRFVARRATTARLRWQAIWKLRLIRCRSVH
jgi:alkanesulfonate monooxygenase SsuD/methylene tetrahydromethanopterin reductase-like flavin-dependent oxidoreductase (luciferase family)